MTCIDRFGGKRFVLAVLTLASVDLLRFLERLDNGSFTAVLIATVGAFIAGDTWQRHIEVKTTGRPVGEPKSE